MLFDALKAPQAVSDTIPETTTQTFRQDVLAESAKQPVLVDFWAPWCTPCKQLRPVLEKALKATKGKVKMVAMNIDEHPQIAGQLGIQSIPAVIAFSKGQPLDGFVGVLPESQIIGFLERLIGPLGPSSLDDMLQQAQSLVEQGQADEAQDIYNQALILEPDHVGARVALSRLYIQHSQLEEAKSILNAIPDLRKNDLAVKGALAALELAEQAAHLGDTQSLERAIQHNPLNHQARFDLALALNAKDQRQEAVDHLIEIIKKDRTFQDDGARKQLVQFFEAWGATDPATLSGRRLLSSILFS